MPKLLLTDQTAAELAKPGGSSDVLYWDTKTKGFGLRVTPTGLAKFIAQGRPAGEKADRRITIGTLGTWSVEQARVKANEFKQEVERSKQRPAPPTPWATTKSTDTQTNNLLNKFLELAGRPDGDLASVFYELGQAFEMGRRSVN